MGPGTEDYIDPTFAICTSIILFTILLIITLVSLRRAKVKRDRERFRERQIARREQLFTELNAKDEEELSNMVPVKRVDKYPRT